jgi:predicted MFS family arabinose efflux permease
LTSTTTTSTTDPALGMSARRGWLGVFSVALGSFVLVLSEFLPIGLLPSIASDLNVSIGTAGLMVVSTGLVGAIAAPVVTVATSRLDRRTVLWTLSLLLVLADVVGALAPTFWFLLIGRVLIGVAVGGFWSIGAGIAGRLVRPASVIRASSLITAGISLATVVSLPLGSLVASISTWRLAFVIGASLGAVALVTQLILLPRIRSVERVTFRALGSLLAVPRARLGLIVTVFAFLAQFTAYTYVAPYLQQLARVSPAVISLALLLFGVAGIGGNFVAGVALSRSVTVTLTTMKLLLAVSVILLPLLATSLPGVFVLLVVWGAVWGALPLGLQTWMLASSPSGPDSSLALFVTTAQLALAGGSVLGGIAVNTLGIAFDFFLAGGVAALGAVVLLILGLRARPVEAGATG